VSNGRRAAPGVPGPDEKETPDPDRRGYDAMQVLQTLMELQKDLSAVGTKTDRLIADVEKIDEKVNDLHASFSWAKGFGVAAVLLIPICAAVVWWFVGDQLTKMRDELMAGLHTQPPAVTSPSTPSPPVKKP